MKTLLLALAGLAIFALLGIAATTLLQAPCVGVADNRDYWRVMRPAGIEHTSPVERPGAFVRCTFETSEARLGKGLTSAAVVAWIAKHADQALSDDGARMDLRRVGVVYLLLTAGIVAAGIAAGAPPILAAALLYALVDPGYLLFFNSFYADPALFLALFGITLWLARVKPWSPALGGSLPVRAAAAASLGLLALLGGASKMQYLLLPAVAGVAVASLAARPAAAVGVRPAPGSPKGRSRKAVLALALLLFGVAGGLLLHFYRGPAPRFLEVNNYHAVFAGLAKVSSEPEPTLVELGIPEELTGMPRKDVWSGRVPMDHPVHEHLEDLSRLRLLGAYLADPRALLRTGTRIQAELATPGVHRRGSFSRAAGHPEGAQLTTPWQLSRLRSLVLGQWPPLVWVILLGAAVWLGTSAFRRRWSGIEAAGLFLLLFAGSQLVVVVVGDGFVALKQHLSGARLAVDFLVMVGLYAAVARVWRCGGETPRGKPESRSPP